MRVGIAIARCAQGILRRLRVVVKGGRARLRMAGSGHFSAAEWLSPLQISRWLAGAHRSEPCMVCAEPEPTVSYFWPGGIVVRLHAACDALWKMERGG